MCNVQSFLFCVKLGGSATTTHKLGGSATTTHKLGGSATTTHKNIQQAFGDDADTKCFMKAETLLKMDSAADNLQQHGQMTTQHR